MNKKDASAVLGVSIRLVEKYASEGRLGEVKYVRGKTGKQADFDPAGVEKLKAELESIDYQLVAPNRRAASLDGALSEQSPALVAFVDMVKGAVSSQVESLTSAIDALRSTVDATPPAPLRDKMTLSFKEAALLSGVPESHLREGYARGMLRGAKIGRGVRVTPDDVRKYVEQRMKGKR
jgi:excisionase family DNA binding protein